ncbi:MAG: hypothetical protein IPK24_18980 [Kineosporiaceae bacterium]|nr:hypothetical protein [Kineosporiaceae bacterium]MBK8077591.1 hypothetical protein [Kineosporiaceae bacterium]
MSSPRRSRWPLIIIGASAGTATWSGWVGLGSLTGFGLVHPLPGIWDGLVINTAITLPVGVEAYAVYALAVATSGRTLSSGARRYTWASAAAALLLGMAGQVAYHLLTAAGVTAAPWWVVTAVSCLPVAVLGAASVLWHVAGVADRAVAAVTLPVPIPEDQPMSSETPEPVSREAASGLPESRIAASAVEPPRLTKQRARRPRRTPPRRERADAATLAAMVDQTRTLRPDAGEPTVRRRLAEANLAASGARVRAAIAAARAADVQGPATP